MMMSPISAPAGAVLRSLEESAVSFDWDNVASYLAGHGLILDLSEPPRRFAGGLANINMLLRIDGGYAVFRRPPDGPLPKGAHDMKREHRVLHGLAPVLPLAPRSLHFCEDGSVAGAPFQILEYRGGRSVRGSDIAPLPDTAETGATLSRLLIDTLSQIHAVDTDAAGLGDLGRPEGFLARTISGWIARGDAILKGQMCAAGREVADWMQAQPAPDADPVLLHNDFKLDNVLLKPDVIAPEVVLDWDMATHGDPLVDLATLLSYWTEPGDPQCMIALDQMPTARSGFLSREDAANAYAASSGRSLDNFRLHRVLAIFRLAVVFHQLAALKVNNPAATPQQAALNPDDLFIFALDVARGKMF
ncbi:phosphotransferase family protein [Sphingobium tyrosinilyticum]|uniref:Phosphotransferase family protein n=1 Tax=Sphingobium tyrosinilyticum TaxID=2715436 RepID=A0ABV9F1I2_9SPHN